MKIEFGLEVPLRDAARRSQHPFSRFSQLKLRALGDNRDVAFEVLKYQFANRVAPIFVGSHGIDRKLQTLVRVFLRSSLAGFVVDDVHSPIGRAVDPVDASSHLRPRIQAPECAAA